MALVLAVLAGLYLRQQQEAQWAADAARYEAIRAQREYRAESAPCTLRFPSGSAGRVRAYDDSLRLNGYPAELASSSDDSEGEHWAEFYATESTVAAARLVSAYTADLDHVLLRQRLWQLYFDGELPDAVDALAPTRRVLARGDQDGWQLQILWLPSPYPPVDLLAPNIEALSLPGQMLDQMRAAERPPWQWQALDEPGPDAARRAYRDAEQHALGWLTPDSPAYREARERFLRRHHAFYLVEAARDLGAGRVLILRRFGQIVGPGSVTRAARLVAEMADSLRCSPAPP